MTYRPGFEVSGKSMNELTLADAITRTLLMYYDIIPLDTCYRAGQAVIDVVRSDERVVQDE